MAKKGGDKALAQTRAQKQQQSRTEGKQHNKGQGKSQGKSSEPGMQQNRDDEDQRRGEKPETTTEAPELVETPAVPTAATTTQPTSPHYLRMPYGNALGTLIEKQFATASSPCRSYSDLERRSGISREALSRYVTTRADRRRSPTIDTLVAIAGALHLSLESVCRAAAATAQGIALPAQDVEQSREEVLHSLVQSLSAAQFSAVVELLRQMQPGSSSS